MPKSNYALGLDGAKHAVKALASTSELMLAVSRSLDPGRAPDLALIDLARAKDIANKVAASLSAAEELARDAIAEEDQAALNAAASPVGEAAAA